VQVGERERARVNEAELLTQRRRAVALEREVPLQL
jgi:hypothetical protein